MLQGLLHFSQVERFKVSLEKRVRADHPLRRVAAEIDIDLGNTRNTSDYLTPRKWKRRLPKTQDALTEQHRQIVLRQVGGGVFLEFQDKGANLVWIDALFLGVRRQIAGR